VKILNTEDIAEIVAKQAGCTPKAVVNLINAEIKYIKKEVVNNPEIGAVRFPWLGILFYGVSSFLAYKHKERRLDALGLKLSNHLKNEIEVGTKRVKNLQKFREDFLKDREYPYRLNHFSKPLRRVWRFYGNATNEEVEQLQKEEWKKFQK
jgi:hypothetical protein